MGRLGPLSDGLGLCWGPYWASCGPFWGDLERLFDLHERCDDRAGEYAKIKSEGAGGAVEKKGEKERQGDGRGWSQKAGRREEGDVRKSRVEGGGNRRKPKLEGVVKRDGGGRRRT